MTRMRVGAAAGRRTRVINEANRSGVITAWLVGGGAALPSCSWDSLMWAIAHSIRSSIRTVGDVAQALAAGDMDNRCDAHGSDEVSGLSRMINLLADTMQGMLTRLRSEAGRSTFSNQLVEALEMSDSKRRPIASSRAPWARSPTCIRWNCCWPTPRALTWNAPASHPKNGSPNCGVESPYSCIAVRRGHPQIFPDAEALNACPKLLGRMGGSISAACVPVNFMGRALGVLQSPAPGQAAESRTDRAAHRARLCTPARASARCALSSVRSCRRVPTA